MESKKVAFTTLGCKVNQYESEAMKGLFLDRGYQVVDFDTMADVYVINTCTVTHLGNRKSRQMIRRAIALNEEAVVAVAGCYAQTSPGEVLEIPGVNLVIGTAERGRIVDLVEEAAKRSEPIDVTGNIMKATEFEEMGVVHNEHRTRAFIKIQEGCNNFCSYCIIPYARGGLRSRKPERVLEEATRLAQEGYQEIVLTGICLGAYGKDLTGNQPAGDPSGEAISLAYLLRLLLNVAGIRRIRLGSVEPTNITPDLVSVIAENDRVCKHLHIPLQSGSDVILQAMNRHYNTMEYMKLVGYLKYVIPDLAVTTDIIVGFPGEKEEHFLHSMELVEEVEFAALHVFKYSTRKGTKAAKLPEQVSPQEKDDRSRRLIELGKSQSEAFARSFCGRTLEVIVEQPVSTNVSDPQWDLSEGQQPYEGLTGNYLRVIFPARPEQRGTLVRVAIQHFRKGCLHGQILD